MKIEMGESLGASWMKHIRQCVLVQTNWKASPTLLFNHRAELEEILKEMRTAFSDIGLDLFKKNSSLDQIVSQTECDVLGVALKEKGPEWKALEVAFHQQGLDYGSKKTTSAKVAAKLVRIAFCLYGYMNVRHAEICFASPKVHPSTLKLLNSGFKLVKEIFVKHGFEYEFNLFVNEEFGKELLYPVLWKGQMVADTAELFVRGSQLMSMFKCEPNAGQGKIKATKPTSTQEKVSEKIGAYAKRVLGPVLKTLSKDELDDFCDKEWCRFTFKLRVPLLTKEKVTAKAKARSYADGIKLYEETYYMTNDWYERNRGPLDEWLANRE